MRRWVRRGDPVMSDPCQLGLVCDGMPLPDAGTLAAEVAVSDVFALWVERVADWNETAARIVAERESEGR